ncbi:hypothetical protein L198_01174 [Cryptococcus wingfieldii CBS 7118]|uniref:Uncharacterized protein n=1 Tax=Cryptococcus wingfieldii CBS 7118 TaxID=1295528 RepID=A0A1E3K443_9TREE|nr:hypothetical protein L198_01174 [Cryptococcus wingfieldii CBS 7118]ODO07593.1 hypothetical protein L198_01174 [Cryptococcus wingfieldii CBS 7118]
MPDPCCINCRRSYGQNILLDFDPSGFWACPRCGLVDESATSAQRLVDFNEHGIQVDDNIRGTKAASWTDWREAKFEEHVKDLLDLYLGSKDPRTSILGTPGENVRTSTRKWLTRILEADRQLFQRLQGHKKASPKTKFFVVIALKMALDENAVAVLHNRLRAAGFQTEMKSAWAGARSDERLPALSLSQLVARLSQFPATSFGYTDREGYLNLLHRRFTKLLRNALTPLESTLIFLTSISQRLRQIADASNEDRTSLLLTRPPAGKGTREWEAEEFSFFEDVEWEKVLPEAYRLYQIQECVYLWGNRSSPSIAIALLFWSIQSLKSLVVPSFSILMEELSAPYGQQRWVALERFKEMRNLLVAWSTSFPEAAIPFPLLPLPPKGFIGDGVSGYGSDSRRGIPEIDMAVTVAPLITQHWRKLLQARSRTRKDVMPLADEIYLARKMFVVRAGDYALLLDPKATLPLHLRNVERPKLGRMSPAVKKFKVFADQARAEIAGYVPLWRVRVDDEAVKRRLEGLQIIPDGNDEPASQAKADKASLAASCQSIPAPETSGHGVYFQRAYPAPPARPLASSSSSDDHSGILMREREEYIKFRYATYLEAGHIVSPACATIMWDWLREKVETGSIPATITPEYLASIGVKADPRQGWDLGNWVEQKKDVWSPVECLLRAGVKPSEIPPHFVPQSPTYLKVILCHYHERAALLGLVDNNILAPVGKFEDEIALLFPQGGEENFEGMFLDDKERAKRERDYKAMEVVGKDEDMDAWRKERSTRERDALSDEEASDSEEEGIPFPPTLARGEPSSPSSPSYNPPPPTRSRAELKHLAAIFNVPSHLRSKDQLELLAQAIGTSDDPDLHDVGNEDDSERFDELAFSSMGPSLAGVELGWGFEEAGDSEEDGEGDAPIASQLGAGSQRKRKAGNEEKEKKTSKSKK